MPERVTEAELFAEALESRLRDLHVAMPAKVESYDATKQTADVVPQFLSQIPDGEGGFVTEQLPKLPGVPVVWPRGGGCFMSFPLKAGDFVLLVVCQRNLGAWRARGDVVDPGDTTMHGLSGAVAYAGMAPDSGAIENADPNNVVIGSDTNTKARIVIKPSGDGAGIYAGADASSFVAMADLVLSRLQSIVTAFNAHTHPYTNGTTPSTTSAPGAPMSAPASVASTNLRADE